MTRDPPTSPVTSALRLPENTAASRLSAWADHLCGLSAGRRSPGGVTIDRETWMHAKPALMPGEPAPATGDYQQLRVFGSSTGVKVTVLAGQPLPAAPIGFTWVLARNSAASPPLPGILPQPGQHVQPAAGRLRAEAAAYQRLAATAQTPTARNELDALAARLVTAAAKLDAGDQAEPDAQPPDDQPSKATKLGCC